MRPIVGSQTGHKHVATTRLNAEVLFVAHSSCNTRTIVVVHGGYACFAVLHLTDLMHLL